MSQLRGLATILVGCLAIAGTVQAQGSGTKAAGAETQLAGVQVQNLNGQTQGLAELVHGKPTLLIFWATWCPSCRELTPRFQEAFDRFGSKGLNVIAVNIGVKDTLATVKQYAADKKLSLPIFFDAAHGATNAYKVAATPGVLLLDPSGAVVSRANTIDFAAIEALLAGKPIPASQPAPMRRGSGSM